MPDPKNYIDDDHEFVQGYVRRKQGYSTVSRRRSWFWGIAWYWRLLIVFGIPILIIALISKYPFILLVLLLYFGL